MGTQSNANRKGKSMNTQTNDSVKQNRRAINAAAKARAASQAEAEAKAKADAGPSQIKIGKYTVDKGIPMPTNVARKGRAEKYPWGLMEIGHSFFIPGEKSGNKVSQKNTFYKGQRHFICGEDTVDDVVGLRVWRDQ